MKQLIVRAALALLACAGPDALAGQGAGRLRVDLNIPALRITVSEGDSVLRTYPVAVGQLGHDTPEGTFTISRAEWNPWWRPPAREWARGEKPTPPGPNNPMGRVKLFFAPLYYIHGTPDEASLGTPASHGCVRMLDRDVVELATLIHDRARPTLPSARIPAVLREARTTRVSRIQDSVTLVIRYQPVVVEGGELRIYPDIYRRRAVHPEAVYQALLAAGYDVRGIDRADVGAVVRRARGRKSVLRVPLAGGLGGAVESRSAGAAPR
jgi:hypothetical protein